MQDAGLVVECSDDDGVTTPRRFGRPGAMREVAEVEDRWPGRGYRYFRVRTREGEVFVLRHDERRDCWSFHSFAAADA